MLNLDLMLLGDAKRFQEMCFRLARYEFPLAVPLSVTWDGGADVTVLGSSNTGDVVFQCKFTKDLLAAKAKIAASLDTLLTRGYRTAQWILCVPVNPSAVFMDWLRSELGKRGVHGHVWARSELLARLEQHPDVVDAFFSSIFSDLASHFSSEHLELFKLQLDPACEWTQADDKVLHFSPCTNVASSDLLIDLIVRNKGMLATAVTGIEARVFDRRSKMHGVPGEGLLFPQVTYAVSIRGGEVGDHYAECEPPLVIKGQNLERFKIRVTETGYAWNGGVQISLLAGKAERLPLPAMRLFT